MTDADIDREVERILGLSDSEVLEEVRASGHDPNDVAALGRLTVDIAVIKVESAWLRRLIQWCRPRLKHEIWRTQLDQYLADGPKPIPDNEPPIVRSDG